MSPAATKWPVVHRSVPNHRSLDRGAAAEGL
jgi:hypothetical protein